MGKILMSGGGGGGASSDELTAKLDDVLKGKTVVASDTDDEIGTGTLELTGDATESQVLSGATFYATDPKVKKTGTVEVQSILSFSAAPYSSTQITFTWTNPAKGAFSGVIIVGKTDNYPTSITDGTQWYRGSGNNYTANGISTTTVSGFTTGTTYYFTVYSYAIKDNADWISDMTYTATATTTKGTQTFTSSTTWTVPEGVRSIDIFCVGGGGGSYSGSQYEYSDTGNDHHINYGAGGGGYTATKKGYAVTPGQQFAVTIGSGGYGTTTEFKQNVVTGGTTSFGSVLSAGGGCGGAKYEDSGSINCSHARPGNGGSGGGASSSNATGGKGGSNGSAGTPLGEYPAGTGQGRTTRAFEESSGTLYAGGGGGCGKTPGSGGAGGGGMGAYAYSPNLPRQGATAGTANTGGGGGGSYFYINTSGARGGSGICIVRWGY